MDLTIEWNGVKHAVELGEDDTPAVMRRKVASAVGLPEDGFAMNFGGELMGDRCDMTQLSAGDEVVLTRVKKFEARAALHALGETDITTERLRSVRDPEVACLFLQADVVTVIPDFFLWNTSLASLDLSAESVVTQIGHNFLHSCRSLTSIDLSGWIHVTQLGMRFLSGCISLPSLDLTALSRVTEIERGFLEGCTALCSLDLTPLISVTQLRYGFLEGCTALCSLELPPINSVTQIGYNFIRGCSALRTLDLSPLRNVTHVGNFFLSRCTSLKSIYLSGCSEVVSKKLTKKLKTFVVESRPKRSRDEPPEESRKRQRH